MVRSRFSVLVSHLSDIRLRIGHSTFLIQYKGINLLTDPVFSEYASPVQFAGPRRLRRTPLSLEELPKIDFICLSHNHYDHLDYRVTQNIRGNPLWIIPKGLDSWFQSNRVKHFIPLDWWDRFHYSSDVSITFTPAQHWCAVLRIPAALL
jgi:N-acyl-phosphatidylethanolamine-hydrolysing phospholipase D